MFAASQIVAHLVGDYILQSDRMALEKTASSRWAAYHALSYALPFLLLTASPVALAVIVGTHFAIDRWRLARYVCWLKNFVGSGWTIEQASAFLGWCARLGRDPVTAVVWTPYRRPWSECTKTGYPDSRPDWMAVWLLIFCDNCLHVLINGVAIEFWGHP